MGNVKERKAGARIAFTRVPSVASILLLSVVAGCGSGGSEPAVTTSTTTTTPPAVTKGPLTYLAPLVNGATNGDGALPGAQIVVLDDTADTFTQSTYQLSPPFQQGAQIINAGATTSGSRGLLDLQLTANYTFNGNNQYVATTSNLPQGGGFALELANRGGGFVQLPGQPVEPVVPTTLCPTFSTTQSYRFLTIPGAFLPANQPPEVAAWNPLSDTAYGSVDISSDGSTVSLKNIKQFTLPSVGGSGAPADPSPASVPGACGATAYGNTISVPGQVIVKIPGIPSVTPAQAVVEIGPTGLLVEDNGSTSSLDGSGPIYQNSLGAGTGAVGLPIPSAAVDTAGLVAAQYLGFVYGAGVFSGEPLQTGWSSHLASFGFSSVPSTCSAVAASTSTLIYGGDFTNDAPSTSSSGFGNCNLALELGTQDPNNHGLYPQATVSLGASYSGNTQGGLDTFPAVAVAGQLQGKFVVFVLGLDATQPWAIYLTQSN